MGVLLASGGCNLYATNSDQPEPQDDDAAAITHPALIDRQSVQIDRELPQAPPPDYIVGPNDELLVTVHDNPDLGTPRQVIEAEIGTRVDGLGRIQLPLLGDIEVADRTLSDIRQHIEQTYAQLLAEPSVTVEVLRYRSQPLYMIGQFQSPGVVYMDRPTNVIQALALVGGLDDDANLRSAHIQRDDEILPVDLYRMLREGDLSQNIWLEPNDAIYIPDDADQQVFVLGSVESPGAVPMIHGQLGLNQALAQVGGPLRSGTADDRIRIIRSHTPTRGELLVLDQPATLDGSALDFPLQAGDIVYVPRDGIGTWNDIVQDIQPTLQLIGNTLQPFVQLQVLYN